MPRTALCWALGAATVAAAAGGPTPAAQPLCPEEGLWGVAWCLTAETAGLARDAVAFALSAAAEALPAEVSGPLAGLRPPPELASALAAALGPEPGAALGAALADAARGAGCEAIGPVVVKLGGGIYAIYCSLPSTVARGLGGLGMSFFGGRYAVTIAAWEAFRSMGGSQVYMYLQDLTKQVEAVWAAHVADEEVDEDKNGVADVKEIDPGQLATRKMGIVFKTIDPEIVARAVSGLWTAYMGVLTVLKFQFARTIALAESIAENLRPAMAKFLGPTLVTVTPPDYQKWISPAVSLLCKIVAGAVAWKVKQLASTVQSGFCGGLIFSRALLQLMRENKLAAITDDQTFLDEIVGWSVGACGIYVQLFKGGPVPYFLSPLFWPLDVIERILKWNVTWMEVPEKAIKQ